MAGRLLYLAVNPLMSRRTWNGTTDELFFTSSIPFSLAPIFLMSLFLYVQAFTFSFKIAFTCSFRQESLTRRGVKTTMFLSKLKPTFFVGITIFFVFEIATSIVRAAIAATQIVFVINIVVYMLVTLALVILFTVTSAMLVRRLYVGEKVSYTGSGRRVTTKV